MCSISSDIASIVEELASTNVVEGICGSENVLGEFSAFTTNVNGSSSVCGLCNHSSMYVDLVMAIS